MHEPPLILAEMHTSERGDKPPVSLTASFLLLAVWVLDGLFHNISDNFNLSWGLYTFLIAQLFSYNILMKGYCAWIGTSASTVVQNHRAECAGHLLNYTIHSLAFFVFGGYDSQQVEVDYMNLGT